MQEVTGTPAFDPRFMDAQGQFWFWNKERSAAYGPYTSPQIAQQALQDYTTWCNTQEQAAVQPKPVSSATAQAVAEYIRLRDERDALSSRQQEELAALDDNLGRGEAYLMEQLKTMGVDSFKVDAGTVFTSTQARSSIPDKGAFTQFVLQTGQVDLLQMRLATANLETWIEQHGGALPPGVTFSRERVVRVRRN